MTICRSCTVTLEPRNSRPRRSSLSDSPRLAVGRAEEGGKLELADARTEAVLDGVPPPRRYSSSLSRTRVRMGGSILGVLARTSLYVAVVGVGKGGTVVIVSSSIGPGRNPRFSSGLKCADLWYSVWYEGGRVSRGRPEPPGGRRGKRSAVSVGLWVVADWQQVSPRHWLSVNLNGILTSLLTMIDRILVRKVRFVLAVTGGGGRAVSVGEFELARCGEMVIPLPVIGENGFSCPAARVSGVMVAYSIRQSYPAGRSTAQRRKRGDAHVCAGPGRVGRSTRKTKGRLETRMKARLKRQDRSRRVEQLHLSLALACSIPSMIPPEPAEDGHHGQCHDDRYRDDCAVLRGVRVITRATFACRLAGAGASWDCTGGRGLDGHRQGVVVGHDRFRHYRDNDPAAVLLEG